MSKTKTPKLPTREKKNKKTDKKLDKTARKIADVKVISDCLLVYSAARASSDEAKFAVNALKVSPEANYEIAMGLEVAQATKKIRIALKAIREARIFISEHMRKTNWVKAMLNHLEDWAEQLDEAWEKAQDILEDKE